MTKVDQFESLFRSAAHELFQYEKITLQRVIVITDVEGDPARAYVDACRGFLGSAGGPDREATWSTLEGNVFRDPSELLARVEAEKPDLICTHRNLHSLRSSLSLGVYLEVLTQTTRMPILVTPHPEELVSHPLGPIQRVMAMTDHLVGDHHLVNVAAALTPPEGLLYLTHVEDRVVFRRYMETISKIPMIDTETADELIRQQLLKEPQDYVNSCRDQLREHGFGGHVETLVVFGQHLEDYRRLVVEEEIDLLVFNTKEDDQLAMHGLAYPLAVELRNNALLML